MKKTLVAASLTLVCTVAFADEAMEQRIDALQRELDALKRQVETNTAQDKQQVETDATQEQQQADASADVDSGLDEDAGTDMLFFSAAADPDEGRTAVGGYGEINYNNYKDDSRRDEFDLQRFILFLGHRFSDRTRLYSEIEFEHSVTKGGDSSSGEVAMEQAYIEQRLTDDASANLRAGLMLLPIGFLNEYHEPPVFYGVERNEVETRIIPTTWREIGFAFQGFVANGLEYNTGITTTPDASLYKDASSGFKDMRTKGNRVTANEFGYFAGLNYRGVPGLQLGGSVWTGNTAQDGQGKGTNATALAGANANLLIWDLHARYAVAGWDLRALYSQGSFSDTQAINASAGLAPGSNKAAPESFFGWYVEAAYRFTFKGGLALAPFARYEDYNTQESVAPGFTADPLNDEQVITAGASFFVHPQVVFKADVQDYETDDTKDRFNVGIGWMF
ncbi:MAG TPA: hypothetical protein VMW70_08225 [Burkholderiales bacterium]|nr:hypothetical protein [Burkholderiales bacterium]